VHKRDISRFFAEFCSRLQKPQKKSSGILLDLLTFLDIFAILLDVSIS
jgi:hypothetical protein